jgi:ubiquinone biosynthesis protein COQ9
MDDPEFDRALITAALDLAAQRGWHRISVAAAARHAGLALDRARARFPGRMVLLLRFVRMADRAALASAAQEGPPRDRLFDLLMRRIDVLQNHRAGVLAVMRALPADPASALLLAAANLRGMGWMLEAAGISAAGPFGRLRAKGLLAVWLWTLRAWQRDASDDLAATMAALDQALTRAEQAAKWLGARPPAPVPPEPPEPEPATPPD